ncbi:2-keto-4-pentenoate hydratase [Lentzea cavernae]|uniref:Hydratase/decarboxylase n=1 Tax=Lentzea cavernae TaxID=2020703 RepID=A0ABQ3MD18_9PSEU|nr:fumarylacetoacetate hydrolase family protein [Lentzea cavernae]GHH34755.1 putative hydratase/decarboxylase [Lentzea cavernae]
MNRVDQVTTVAGRAIDAAVARLADAERTRVPCAPVRDLIGPDDLDAAYRVQAAIGARRVGDGARVVGRKIGLTVGKRPCSGVLYDDMAFIGGDTVPADLVLQPRVGAGIAFVLGKDLADGPLDPEQVREAIAYGVAALEVCGSRIGDWDLSPADAVADNASAGAFVTGPRRVALRDFDPEQVEMSLYVNEISIGGVECAGDPLDAIAVLAQTSREYGTPLRAGEVVLAGAAGPMRPVAPGDVVVAHLSGLGAVKAYIGRRS